MDTFDPKSALAKWDGKPFPATMEPTQFNNNGATLASPWEFTRHGRSGLPVSSLFPCVARCADDLCVIRSMWTDVPAHEEATKIMTTGDFRLPKPSIGAWVTYGLGSDNQNLPAFVAMNPGGFPSAGNVNWQSAFMPGAFQGTYVDPTNTRIEQIIENIKSQFIGSSAEQRQQLD